MNKVTKFLALLLAVVISVSALPVVALAEDSADGIVLIALSDFQANSDSASAANVAAILEEIAKDYPSADGFIFCGDLDADFPTQNMTASLAALTGEFEEVYGSGLNAYIVQGNHDGTAIMQTGAHDTSDYGVYIINEDDYSWEDEDSKAEVEATAAALESYLNTKLQTGWDKPIFVASHLPLHYSNRTEEAGDARYASIIFDVLNDAGMAGLNITYLYGHNHRSGFDNYLGGAAVYLPADSYPDGTQSTICIAENGSTSSWTVEPLHFAYMNAGFVGHYGTTVSGADKTLTMSVFHITDAGMTVERYDEDGKHNLKSAGTDADGGNFSASAINNKVLADYTITLTNELTDAATGVKVSGLGLSGLTVTALTAGDDLIDTVESNGNYTYVSVDTTGVQDGARRTVSIPVGSLMLPKLFYVGEDGAVQRLHPSFENGYAVFTAGADGDFILTETDTYEWTIVVPASTDYIYTLDTDGRVGSEPYMLLAEFLDIALVGTNYEEVTVVGDTVIVNNDEWDWTLTDATYYTDKETTVNYKNDESEYSAYINTGYLYNDEEVINIYNAAKNQITVVTTGGTYATGKKSVKIQQRTWTYAMRLAYNGYYLSEGDHGKALQMKDRADDATLYKYTPTNTGRYDVHNSKNTYLYWNTSYGAFRYLKDTPASLRLYEFTGTRTYGEKYALLDAEPLTFTMGDYASSGAVINKLTQDIIKVYVSENEDHSDMALTDDYQLSITTPIDPFTPGQYKVAVKYNNVTLGYVTVNVLEKTAASITLTEDHGSVRRLSPANTVTGGMLHVVYEDGSEEDVNVNLGMVSGDNLNIKVMDTYENLTVTYAGKSVTGFTLEVLEGLGEASYPEYPNGGSVRVGKTGTAIDWRSTGIARIELTAAGIPINKGSDVIIMMDTSSSMSDQYGWTGRIPALRNAVSEMLEIFQQPNPDGTPSDIRVAIADFNGYDRQNYWPYNDLTGDGGTGYGNGSPIEARIFTGDGTESIGAFVDVNTIDNAGGKFVDNIVSWSGTNYDFAFTRIYNLFTAAQEDNALNGVERDLIVVFMTDGCPHQFNGFVCGNKDIWNRWTLGTMTDYDLANNVPGDYGYFYSTEGLRIANAVKGDPGSMYEVIDPYNQHAQEGKPDYLKDVPGLGAKVYSIGLSIGYENEITADTVNQIIHDIASVDKNGNALYFPASDNDAMIQAFSDVASEIRMAARDAYFVDRMGESYDLQLASRTYNYHNYQTDEDEIKTLAPEITVSRYSTYNQNQVGTYVGDRLVTTDDVGNRYGTPDVLETVTFNAAGTEAYSDQLSGNILGADGIIRGKTFLYNTTGSTVTVYPWGEGTEAVELPSETFYWMINIISNEEFVLSYYVYLTDSMNDPGVPDGIYDTNEYAVLHFTNWLDESDCQLETKTPRLPWGDAVVNVAFYLVDAEGNTIVNRETGLTGSFNYRVPVVDPYLYSKLLYNTTLNDDANQVIAAEAVPAGYMLYDPDAAYKVIVNSDGSGKWSINKGTGKNVTTYVVDYGDNPTNALTDAGYDHDYTHTTVWFAVVLKPTPMPETIVIDYGKPVHVEVLNNDLMFGKNGELGIVSGIAPLSKMPADAMTTRIAPGFAPTLTTDFGTYAIDGNRVVYTPTTMSITDAETVVVAIRYDGSLGSPYSGYYYTTLTVVPATIIYYEETFLQFNGEWTLVESGDPVAEQAEDRPAPADTNPKGSDADNIYGYDAGYLGYAANPSNARQYVTTVTKGMTNPPSATFTFTGSGFDVISVTDKLQGLVIVEVFDEDGELVCYDEYDDYYGSYEAPASWAVDCYYGYKSVSEVGYIKFMCRYTDSWHCTTEIVTEQSLNEGEIEVDTLPYVGDSGQVYVMYETAYDWTESDENVTLYQIPVLKSRDALEYGTYTVVITPTYSEFFDHVKDDTSYNFAIDAIRIYDPAGVHDVCFDPDNGLDNVNKYYLEDNEAWPQFIVLHSTIVSQDEFSASGEVEGAVFIDAFKKNGEVSDYDNFGPNNEVYLAPGQSIVFGLSADGTDIAAVHLAAKAVNGAATYTVNGAEKTVTSATDLYTDITKQVTWEDNMSDYILITNTSENGSILSLTNLKITFNTMPGEEEEVDLFMSRAFVASALSAIEGAKLAGRTAAPVVTEPETEPATEPETEPETEAETEPATDPSELFDWINGRQLNVDKKAVGKAPSVSKNDKYASSGVIPYVKGETDVVNIAKYDKKTTATVLWLNAKGTVIGVTETFDAGKDVNVNSLKVKFGTKDGAVSYRLTVNLANKAKDGPAAFEVVAANSVLSGTGN